VPVSYFLLFLYFRKVTHEIFLKLDETKAKHPEIYRSFQGTEEETAHTTGRRGPGLGRAPYVCGRLGPLLTMPLRLYRPPDGKNLNTRSLFQKHIVIHRHRRPEIGRVQKLFPAPCRRGESPLEVFFIAMLVSGVMSE
jgi:hypothetical protein